MQNGAAVRRGLREPRARAAAAAGAARAGRRAARASRAVAAGRALRPLSPGPQGAAARWPAIAARSPRRRGATCCSGSCSASSSGESTRSPSRRRRSPRPTSRATATARSSTPSRCRDPATPVAGIAVPGPLAVARPDHGSVWLRRRIPRARVRGGRRRGGRRSRGAASIRVDGGECRGPRPARSRRLSRAASATSSPTSSTTSPRSARSAARGRTRPDARARTSPPRSTCSRRCGWRRRAPGPCGSARARCTATADAAADRRGRPACSGQPVRRLEGRPATCSPACTPTPTASRSSARGRSTTPAPASGRSSSSPRSRRQAAEGRLAGARRIRIVTGNPDTRRDFTDVRDVVRAYRLLAERAAARDLQRLLGALDLGRRPGPAARRAVVAPIEVEHEVDPARVRAHEVMDLRGSNDRIHDATGWQPEIPFGQTMRDTLRGGRRSSRRPGILPIAANGPLRGPALAHRVTHSLVDLGAPGSVITTVISSAPPSGSVAHLVREQQGQRQPTRCDRSVRH